MIEKDLLFTIQAQKKIIKEQEERINGLKEIIERQDEEIRLLYQLKQALEEKDGCQEKYISQIQELMDAPDSTCEG